MPLIPPFDLQQFLTEPWSAYQIDTTLRIVTLAALVSIACGLVGTFLILRRMALVGDAISHSVLPGIVLVALIAKTLSGPLITLGAMAAGLLTVVVIEWIHKHSRVKQDAAIGISFTVLFAIGVLMVTGAKGNIDLDADCILFGNIAEAATTAGIPDNIIQAGVIVLLTALLIVAFFKELLVSAFDAALASSLGIRSNWVHYGTMAWLSVVVVTAFEAVGSVMVVAVLIIPGATALLLTDRLWKALLFTVLHALISSVLGYHVALWLNSYISACIVVVGLGLFGLAWLFSPSQGLISVWLGRMKLREAIESGALR